MRLASFKIKIALKKPFGFDKIDKQAEPFSRRTTKCNGKTLPTPKPNAQKNLTDKKHGERLPINFACTAIDGGLSNGQPVINDGRFNLKTYKRKY